MTCVFWLVHLGAGKFDLWANIDGKDQLLAEGLHPNLALEKLVEVFHSYTGAQIARWEEFMSELKSHKAAGES